MIQRFHDFIKRAVDFEDKSSPAYHFRRKRMDAFERKFEDWFARGGKTVEILDIGGTLAFWTVLDFKYLDQVHITLLNLEEVLIEERWQKVFKSVAGDAADLSGYADNSFDLAFSNSVIEHVGDYERQKKMVSEMSRVARHRYIQTPNKYFPIEPHYGFPLFQFFPLWLKMYMVQHYDMRYKKAENEKEAYEIAGEIRLLSLKELKELIPDAVVFYEKVFGIIKSFYVFF